MNFQGVRFFPYLKFEQASVLRPPTHLNLKADNFSRFQLQLCHQRSLLKCHCTFYIYGPLVKIAMFRFLKHALFIELSTKIYSSFKANSGSFQSMCFIAKSNTTTEPWSCTRGSSLHGGMEDVDLSCLFRAMSHNICSNLKYLLPHWHARFLVQNFVRLCSIFAGCSPIAISAQ